MSKNFLEMILKSDPKATAKELAVALLWYHGLENSNACVSPKQLAHEMEQAGFSKQNITLFKRGLSQDSRTVKGPKDTLKIKIKARASLDKKYINLVKTKPLPKSDSVIPFELVEGTRGYIEKVVRQLNLSYDQALYDCCAVMCRRLLETLIIEVYEQLKRTDELKDKDGNFMMFSGLVSILEKDKSINLSRNSMKGLKDFKKLGDLSAHSRRYNALKSDIDKTSAEMRICVEELLHLSNLVKA